MQEALKREEQERLDAVHFADATGILAAGILEELDPCNIERAVHTRLIENLRRDARAVYRDWREHNPEMAAALVDAGRRLDLRLQTRLLIFVQNTAAEGHRDAA